MSRVIFIAGTDTEVGKTYVGSLIVDMFRRTGRSVGVYKPVASGCRAEGGTLVSDDAEALHRAARCPDDLMRVCPQRFLAPLAPPQAAASAGTQVDVQRMYDGLEYWKAKYPVVITEGAGGVYSPLADGLLNAEFARTIEADVILVAANRLGVINHTLLTVDACRNQIGRAPLAIMLNRVSGEDELSSKTNQRELQRYCEGIAIHDVPFRASQLDIELPI